VRADAVVVDLTCPICGKAYQTTERLFRRGKHKTCGMVCGKKLARINRSADEAERRKASEVQRACARCEGEFTIQRSMLERGRGKYCSNACKRNGSDEDRRGVYGKGSVVRTCPCGVVFKVTPSAVERGRGTTCSVACGMAKRKSEGKSLSTAHKFGRTVKQRTPPPQKPDWQQPLTEASSMVACARCQRIRERGIRCVCERREP
jgi:hypothetical protein